MGLRYTSVLSSSSERAEARRRKWKGGVARSSEEAEAMDFEFWMAATPEERLLGVTQLIEEMSIISGQHAPTRLQRSVGGVRPRRG